MFSPGNGGVYITGTSARQWEKSLSLVGLLPHAAAPGAREGETQSSVSSLRSMWSSAPFASPFATPAKKRQRDELEVGGAELKKLVVVGLRCNLGPISFAIWQKNSTMKALGFEFVAYKVEAGAEATPEALQRIETAYMIVLDDDMAKETNRSVLLKWAKWDGIPDIENVYIVSRAMIQLMIDEKKSLDPRQYLHPLQLRSGGGGREEATAASACLAMEVVGNMQDQKKPPMQSPTGKREYRPNAAKFLCQANPTTAVPLNLNEEISEVFDKLLDFYEGSSKSGKIADQGRVKAYRAVSKYLKTLDYKLTDTNFKQKLSGKFGFGPGVMKKISEILNLGYCCKLRAREADPVHQVIRVFCKIWGVGPATASNLYHQMGFRTIEAIRKNPQSLSNRQRIGLKYYEELQERIPRQEVDRIFHSVLAIAQGLDSSTWGYLCGSHRRRKPDSGDVDVLLILPPIPGGADGTKFNAVVGIDGDDAAAAWAATVKADDSASYSDDQTIHSREQERAESFLQRLLEALKRAGILTDHLAGHKGDTDPSMGGGWGGNRAGRATGYDATASRASYMGIGVDTSLAHGAKHRRIDIKIYPPWQLPYALLYFTGTDLFNRSMRLYAKKIRTKEAPKGYTLSDKGLFPKLRWHHKTKECINGPCVVGLHTEREVMAYLGLSWREPWERTGGVDSVVSASSVQDDRASTGGGVDPGAALMEEAPPEGQDPQDPGLVEVEDGYVEIDSDSDSDHDDRKDGNRDGYGTP